MKQVIAQKIIVSFMLYCIAHTGIVHAEEKIYTASTTYMLTADDHKPSIEEQAMEDLRRTALEQVGVYLVAETQTKNNGVTKDEIRSVSLGGLRLLPESVKKIYQSERNGLQRLTLTASFFIDESLILKNLENIAKLHEAKNRSTEKKNDLVGWQLGVNPNMGDELMLQYYKKAIAFDPTNGNAWAHQAITKKSLYGYPNYYHHWDEKTQHIYLIGQRHTDIIALWPGSFSLEEEVARILGLKEEIGKHVIIRNRMLDALADLEQAVKLNPSLDQAWYRKGELEWILGETMQAQRSFQKAFALYPTWKTCYDGTIAIFMRYEKDPMKN